MKAEFTFYVRKGFKNENGRWSHFFTERYDIYDEDEIIGIKEEIALNHPDVEIVLVEILK